MPALRTSPSLTELVREIEALWREYYALPETHYSKRGKVIAKIRVLQNAYLERTPPRADL